MCMLKKRQWVFGLVVDEGMGGWFEGEIRHVGMFRRTELEGKQGSMLCEIAIWAPEHLFECASNSCTITTESPRPSPLPVLCNLSLRFCTVLRSRETTTMATSTGPKEAEPVLTQQIFCSSTPDDGPTRPSRHARGCDELPMSRSAFLSASNFDHIP